MGNGDRGYGQPLNIISSQDDQFILDGVSLKLRKTITCIAILLIIGIFPTHAISQEYWGALYWAAVDESYTELFNHLPTSQLGCRHVASLNWNYPARRDAMNAARQGCRKEWMKTGLRVPLVEKSCGRPTDEDPIGSGTVLGAIFGAGQCAAYASGRWWSHGEIVRCPISGVGVASSKIEAENLAMSNCLRNFIRATCKVKMSACNASK